MEIIMLYVINMEIRIINYKNLHSNISISRIYNDSYKKSTIMIYSKIHLNVYFCIVDKKQIQDLFLTET